MAFLKKPIENVSILVIRHPKSLLQFESVSNRISLSLAPNWCRRTDLYWELSFFICCPLCHTDRKAPPAQKESHLVSPDLFSCYISKSHCIVWKRIIIKCPLPSPCGCALGESQRVTIFSWLLFQNLCFCFIRESSGNVVNHQQNTEVHRCFRFLSYLSTWCCATLREVGRSWKCCCWSIHTATWLGAGEKWTPQNSSNIDDFGLMF